MRASSDCGSRGRGGEGGGGGVTICGRGRGGSGGGEKPSPSTKEVIIDDARREQRASALRM